MFCWPSKAKDIIGRDLKFTGYVHNKILTENIFSLNLKNKIVAIKSVYIFLIIGLECKANPNKIMGWESSDVVRLYLGPLLQHQTNIAKQSAYNSFIIGSRGLQCETKLQEIMG